MKLKLFLQIILSVSIFLILIIFYYKFFISNNQKTEINNKKNDFNEEIVENQLSNELVNIEYNSTDDEGNTFYINSERATVSFDGNQNNKVNLEGVVSIINLKNKGIINIYSNNAIYDKINNNTLFFNQVKIEYLDNEFLSGNLDVVFSEKVSKIYNDVIYNNEESKLSTDIILIDMITGDIKLEMNKEKDKIQLFTKNEYIN